MDEPSRTSPGRRSAALAAVLLAGLALVACGDEESADDAAEEDRAQIEEVVVAYGAAEGEEACELMSAAALDQLGGDSGCTRLFEGEGGVEFTVERVTVEEGMATVDAINEESETVVPLELTEEEGEWRISLFPGLGDFGAQPGDLAPDEPITPEEALPDDG